MTEPERQARYREARHWLLSHEDVESLLDRLGATVAEDAGSRDRKRLADRQRQAAKRKRERGE